MIPAYNKKRCDAFPFETGIHFRRRPTSFPKKIQPSLTRDSNPLGSVPVKKLWFRLWLKRAEPQLPQMMWCGNSERPHGKIERCVILDYTIELSSN
ncbi:hypothetical protein TNCV_3593011 [Trichonephila clavipes]|nr:hypothetical protein TNCV_3593011 [Trichonephila clavipes]